MYFIVKTFREILNYAMWTSLGLVCVPEAVITLEMISVKPPDVTHTPAFETFEVEMMSVFVRSCGLHVL